MTKYYEQTMISLMEANTARQVEVLRCCINERYLASLLSDDQVLSLKNICNLIESRLTNKD